MEKERSTQEVASLTGLTSRTLRHYDQIGLLTPSRVSAGGQRWYDAHALVRLQRILMLRQLGLGLADIRRVLEADIEPVDALQAHALWLGAEVTRLGVQLAAVTNTITALREREPIMAEKMFDGFDHAIHRDEVEQRWGKAAYASSDAWWRAKSPDEKAEFRADQAALMTDWVAASTSGADPAAPDVQALSRRQWNGILDIPGTPGYGGDREQSLAYFVGLAEMYVVDERFAANYGGVTGAQFVRDAMVVFAERMRGA